jgi:hypothetical protein
MKVGHQTIQNAFVIYTPQIKTIVYNWGVVYFNKKICDPKIKAPVVAALGGRESVILFLATILKPFPAQFLLWSGVRLF